VGPTDVVRTRLRGVEFNDWLMKPVLQSSLYDSLAKALPHAAPDGTAARKHVEVVAPAGGAGAQLTLPTGRKPRILVAEDNPINQKLARLQLRKLGMEVDTVANGREAVEALSRIPYDVVLMDCQMPELDGYEATREIRRREGTRQHTKIIAMTAHALAGDRDKCLEAGMDAYVSKPVRAEMLETTLRQVIGSGAANGIENGAPPAVTEAAGDPAALNGAAPPFDAKTLAALRDDGLLDELIDLFLGDTPAAIERIGAAFALKDFKSAASESHRLKGSAAALGAQPMFELCQQLQLIASLDELEKSQPLFAQLKIEAERACRGLQAKRSDAAAPAAGQLNARRLEVRVGWEAQAERPEVLDRALGIDEAMRAHHRHVAENPLQRMSVAGGAGAGGGEHHRDAFMGRARHFVDQ